MFKSKRTKLKLSVKAKNAKLLNIGLMFIWTYLGTELMQGEARFG